MYIKAATEEISVQASQKILPYEPSMQTFYILLQRYFLIHVLCFYSQLQRNRITFYIYELIDNKTHNMKIYTTEFGYKEKQTYFLWFKKELEKYTETIQTPKDNHSICLLHMDCVFKFLDLCV